MKTEGRIQTVSLAMLVVVLAAIAMPLKFASSTDAIPANWKALAQEALDDVLKDPASAKTKFAEPFLFRGQPIVCGRVNAKNGYGGYSGYTWFRFDIADGAIYFDGENVGLGDSRTLQIRLFCKKYL